MKIITKNWEWQTNIIIGIIFKSGYKIFFLIECYSNKNILQWKVLLKPDNFILYNSLFSGLCTINMYSIYNKKWFKTSM